MMATILTVLTAIPWDQILIQTVNGIVTGMILALIASGLTLIFGIMDVVNFAHGELFMLGAYVGVVVIAYTGNFWLALILSALIVAILGAAMQIVTLRPLIGRDPLNTILATFGIGIGLGVSSTSPSWRDASAALALLSGIYLILQAVLSFGLGGYLAGRIKAPSDAPLTEEVERWERKRLWEGRPWWRRWLGLPNSGRK